MQGSGGGAVAGLEGEVELVRAQLVSGHGHGAVAAGGPLAGLGRPDDALDVLAEPGSEDPGVRSQLERADGLHVVGEHDVLHVDLVPDERGQGLEAVEVASGDGQAPQRQARPQAVVLPQPEGDRAHLANAVHRVDQLRIGGQRGGVGPVLEVDRGRAVGLGVQSHVDLVAHERQQRRGDPHQGAEHREQRVAGIGAVLGGHLGAGTPEPLAGPADVPVVERVEEGEDLLAGTGDVEGVHAVADAFDQLAGLGQDVAVEHAGRVGAEPAPLAVRVGVQGEERVRVPDRVDDQAHHLADVGGVGRDAQVAAAQDRRRHQVPAERVGAEGGHHLFGVRVVAQLLGELAALVVQHDSVADDVGEGRSIEQGHRQDVQRVEPAAGLGDVLDDEVGGGVLLEPFTVLERVVHLGEGHGTRLEPAVEHLGDPPHHRPAGRVVGVGPDQLVDGRAVQVVEADAEVGLDLGQAAVDVEARVRGVVGAPHRDG